MTFVHIQGRAHPDDYVLLRILNHGEDNMAAAAGNFEAGVGHKSGLVDGEVQQGS